jgi:hypothetical protein
VAGGPNALFSADLVLEELRYQLRRIKKSGTLVGVSSLFQLRLTVWEVEVEVEVGKRGSFLNLL